jgi:sigma-B regulation protein RsbU (phosphoserine phosphatase)
MIQQNNKSTANSGFSNRLARWLAIVALVWGVPTIIFWTGLLMYQNDWIDQQSQQIFNELDYQLDNYIYGSSPVPFFQPGFNKLFAQLKGLPANPEILGKIINEYKSTWPPGLMEIYLFDGESNIFPTDGARPEHELFFKLVNAELEKNNAISPAQIASVGQFLPSPDLCLTNTREQRGKIVELGNPDRYSYCFFDRDKSFSRNLVAGILIFIHRKHISTSEILEKTISMQQRQNYGYVNADGDSRLPTTLNIAPGELLDYFQQYPVNSFTLNDHLIHLKRLDEYVLLVGAMPKPGNAWLILFSLAILFVIASFYFFKTSYHVVVRQIRFQYNIRRRLTGLFALCYALPLVAAMFLTIQYMLEFKHSLEAEIRHQSYRRLAEIDSGFNRFITAKLVELRNLSAEMQKSVGKPEQLKQKLLDYYQNFDADSVHIIASNSNMLYTSNLLTAEIRRHYLKPRKEKQRILESWKARHAQISDLHMQMLFSEPEPDGKAPIPKNSAEHGAFEKLFRSTALSAMEFYNKTRGINVIIPRTGSNLVIDTIIESNTQSLFQSARTNISRFTNIQGMEEIFLAYLDVLHGPEKEAWYAFALLIDLVNYERQYFEKLYTDLKSRSEIMERVFPEEDVRAVSSHQFAANFPSAFEFNNFEPIIKRSSTDFKTFTQQVKIEGKESLVSVLKASYLKHYLLIKIQPMSMIDEIYNQRLYQIFIFFAVVIIIGVVLAKLLSRLFVTPISDIMNGVKALAERNYEHRIPLRSANEFGVLALAFNQSAEILKDLAISETIRKNLYPELEFRCGSYLVSTANSNSRIILSDFFDYFPLRQGNYAIILAEVSGNDISAAYLTAMLKTAFTLLCPCFPTSPELILDKLNQIFVPYHQKGHLTTCFIGLIDPTNDKMLCANAGQSYPACIGVGDSDEKSFLSLPSTPLGLSESTRFTRHEVALKKRAMVLYSDGAVNLTDPEGIKIGHERFIEIVATSIRKDTRNPSEEIIKRLLEESISVPWRDDITVLTIQNRI